jgi:L-iditol 2-dehydrogenase
MCTEYKAYKAGNETTVLGHEAAGEVVEIAQPGRVDVGDRVVVMPLNSCGVCGLCLNGDYIHCQNTVDPLAVCGSETGTATYAEYLIKQDWQLLTIPDGMSYDHASMACCGLGPTFGAIHDARVDSFDTVMITGLGPVGLGGVINAKFRGATVFAVESHPYRKSLAKELGADFVFNPGDDMIGESVREVTDGRGIDVGVDCTGVPQAQRLLINAAKRKGSVYLVGEGGGLEVETSKDMIRKGLTIRGSWHWNLSDVPEMFRMISRVGDSIDKQITHRFPLEKVQDAWELQLTGECGKILLDP